MNIGETLAEARQDAGLTVTQVSERTRIRETVIRAMERDDFSLCGGKFYARGHIRSICQAIRLDSEPLVRAFDDANGGAPQAVSAVAAFEPERPLRFRERRSPNWTAAMAVVLAVIMVYGIFQVFSGSDTKKVIPTAQQPRQPAAQAPKPVPSPSTPAAMAPRTTVTVQVRAVRASWLNVQDAKGKRLFSGLVHRGYTRKWTAKKKIRILVGNGPGIRLVVNGKDLGSPGGSGQILRLTFGPEDPQTA